ncbi:MAG: EAL domain-containing protein [Cellvibrionaceae bacterium]|nr:EAL domain-containing protein [Cellvibrionaceae bacterium]
MSFIKNRPAYATTSIGKSLYRYVVALAIIAFLSIISLIASLWFHLAQFNWAVIAEQTLADYLGIFIILICVLITALVVLLIRRAEKFTRIKILQPLKQLQAAVKQFECGNLLYRAPTSDQHEFNELAVVLNNMAARLHQTLADLSHNLNELKQSRHALSISEQGYRSVVNSIQEVIFQTDRAGHWTFLNQAWSEITGFSLEQSLGHSLFDFIDPQDQHHQHAIKQLLQGDSDFFQEELRCCHVSGEFRWVEFLARTTCDAHNNIIGISGTLNNITKRRQAYDELKLIASVYTHAREGIMITTEEGNIIEVNPAFLAITGYARQQVIGKNLRAIRSYQHSPGFYIDLWRGLKKEGYWSGDIRNQHFNGQPYTISLTLSAVLNENGKIQSYVGLFSDITERQAHQEQLEHIAHFDALTDLPNRLMLLKGLEEAISQPEQNLAVVYLDLDGFKEINDNYGHAVGDKFLRDIAKKMQRCLRQEDMIGRLGGDEFVAVLMGVSASDRELPLLKRLLEAASTQVYIDGYKLQASASLGVTFYPQDESITADKLLRQADQAMYEAKLAGRNQCRIFDTLKDSLLQGQNKHLERIRNALLADEFTLYYQPKVNMYTGELRGVEALIRWQDPARGLLLPSEFIPLIEDSDLAIDLGNWVINRALKQIGQWQKQGLNTKVSVNISGYQLLQINFVSKLQQLIRQHENININALEIEVLESNALEDIEHISAVIRQCQALNINFALDDFGTGYSTLTYLKHLPASQLKIDRSFVHDLLDNPDNVAIVDSVMGLANAFQREVIAEGVETVTQGKLLLQLGCELAQGNYIAQPMPPEKLLYWSKTWQPDASWKNQHRISRTHLPLVSTE